MKTSQEDSHDEASSVSSAMDDAEVSLQIMASNQNQATETINRATPHISGADAFEPAATNKAPEGDEPYREAGDEIFDKVSRGRKTAIVAVLSFGAFLSPISSTSVLAATPEVAATYHTSGSIINLSNAAYMIVMALSPLFWGPMSQVYGRRIVALSSSAMFFLLSLATALAPNLASFIVFRAASAFGGTAFILIGPACIGDIYRPTERGAAMGWFLTGTLVGPAFGPFIGGIIVTYSSWRSIFWLQTALAAAGFLGVYFVVSETAHRLKINDLKTLSGKKRALTIISMISPMRVLRLFQYPNVALVAGGSASLTWNMYSLLTPIRYVLNPRFNLESPLLSGLFYLAPGFGYLAGTFKRGVRVPEDRLRSTVPFMSAIIPGSMLVYGWTVDQEAGGIPVPVIAMFVQGVAQLFCFPSYNTYCLDVMPGQGAEVAATNFFARYLVGCVASAVVLPAIEAVGIGWFSTISAAYLIVSALATIAAIRWGKCWRERMEAKLENPREK
ncbi:dityrosine transporter [Fusarium sporotrichioides]|uniref:Dityrosine transporter n=1 Tax=Fusarium sporotrichioides TaxID=5514 RepID=A0A395SQ28_FUSSP|nr:dityrosine transporter [Fusarium sporotrichioides]